MLIKKVGILGSGVMGSQLAAHFANAGIDVLLLDILPPDLTQEEKRIKSARNRIALKSLENLEHIDPKPLYSDEFISLIEVGNFEDDIEKLRQCDFIVEAIIEDLAVKRKFFKEKVIQNIGNDAILSSNTSGLSINKLIEDFPADIKKRFLITHFFNPPRYMHLVEVITSDYTQNTILDIISLFLKDKLGKGIVHAKDSPNFIANRIGLYVILSAIKYMFRFGLTVEDVDRILGQAVGFPKTAIFRLADLVGIDTIIHVARNSYEFLENDEERNIYKLPDFLSVMLSKNLLGNKTGKGFYKVERTSFLTNIYYLDLESMEYVDLKKRDFESVGFALKAPDPKDRINILLNGSDKASKFAWNVLRDSLLYSFRRIPEIASDVISVDNAMRWGFGWELGPFEILDAITVKKFTEKLKEDGITLPYNLKDIESFYKLHQDKELFFDMQSLSYKEASHDKKHINLLILKKNNRLIEGNSRASLIDLSDGIFALEFHSKLNTIGEDILKMAKKSVLRAENEAIGLIVANQGKMFSAGANLMLISSLIAEGGFDEIDFAIKMFQEMTAGFKYARIPVVSAPYNITFGGGCEICLNSDAVVSHAETYMGLVETSIGLLPAGGGTKEMTLRAVSNAQNLNVSDVTPVLSKYFENIAKSVVSKSAWEAFKLGYMKEGDCIVMNIDNLIYDAKLKALSLAQNYRPLKPLKAIPAPGRDVFASISNAIWSMKEGNFISEYDAFVAQRVLYVMTGGDVSSFTLISEKYLLELERQEFLKLCSEKKTHERINYMLKTGKPLRN